MSGDEIAEKSSDVGILSSFFICPTNHHPTRIDTACLRTYQPWAERTYFQVFLSYQSHRFFDFRLRNFKIVKGIDVAASSIGE